jgi:hypothetical protein
MVDVAMSTLGGIGKMGTQIQLRQLIVVGGVGQQIHQ